MMVWGESIVRENPMVNRFIPFKPTVSGNDHGRPALNERSPASAAKPKLLDHVRHAIRARHDSRRTVRSIFHFPFAICHLSLKMTRSLSQQGHRTIG
jgi:hypothetical protein